ncbi:MAG: hypothetical protein K6F34_01150 [Lachnospiraceae bacterium]|nr:hypothetical protein [Lachnospiraceae bacterium]
MGLFKSRAEIELDGIIRQIDMNMSNNYKDAAQDGLKEFASMVDDMKRSGKVKPKVLARYESMLDEYKAKMQGYTHKDQKPFWT